MTEKEYGKIVEADVVGDKIVYTAHSNGRVLTGEFTRRIGPHTVLSDSSMKDLAEQIVGTKIEWPHQDALDYKYTPTFDE